MAPTIAHVLAPDRLSDPFLAQAVARLGSSPSASDAARASLAAYNVARAKAALDCEAIWEAEAAFRSAADRASRSVLTGLVEGMHA